MELEELRANKKMGEDDPALIAEIQKQKVVLEKKYEALLEELRNHWKDWDAMIDRGASADAVERKQIIGTMVDVLNRRNYIRNLVRDANAALEED
jgi:molecular chaperone HscB